MGEFTEEVVKFREGHGNFDLIADRMMPSIRKYMGKLYKDDAEDVKQEMLIALWMAVIKMDYCKNDWQIIKYLNSALRMRFLELYRESRDYHDYVVTTDMNTEGKDLALFSCDDVEISKAIITYDIESYIVTCPETKKRILRMIVFDELPDSEIADKLSISRQYVNRVRRELRQFIERR